MLHTDPVSCGEFFDRPLAVVPPQTGILLSAKRAIRQIIDRRIIDVSHAGLQTAQGGRRARDRALPQRPIGHKTSRSPPSAPPLSLSL